MAWQKNVNTISGHSMINAKETWDAIRYKQECDCNHKFWYGAIIIKGCVIGYVPCNQCPTRLTFNSKMSPAICGPFTRNEVLRQMHEAKQKGIFYRNKKEQ